jgi:hypothetical protein
MCLNYIIVRDLQIEILFINLLKYMSITNSIFVNPQKSFKILSWIVTLYLSVLKI